MKTPAELESFLHKEAVGYLKTLQSDTAPLWGSMNAHQLIEHLSTTLKVSNGKIDVPLTTDPDKVDKYKAIGLSERPFNRDINNPLISASIGVYRTSGLDEAIQEFQREMDDFMAYFKEKGKDHLRTHNFIGHLNYEEWLFFHYKHFQHHFMQFGLVPLADRIS